MEIIMSTSDGKELFRCVPSNIDLNEAHSNVESFESDTKIKLHSKDKISVSTKDIRVEIEGENAYKLI